MIRRGINFNPGAEPGDMVSVRIRASEHLIVSCRKLRARAVQDVEQLIERGRGPCNAGEVLTMMADWFERSFRTAANLAEEMVQIDFQCIEGWYPYLRTIVPVRTLGRVDQTIAALIESVRDQRSIFRRYDPVIRYTSAGKQQQVVE